MYENGRPGDEADVSLSIVTRPVLVLPCHMSRPAKSTTPFLPNSAAPLLYRKVLKRIRATEYCAVQCHVDAHVSSTLVRVAAEEALPRTNSTIELDRYKMHADVN